MGMFQLPRFPLCQCLKVSTWLMPMTGRHRGSLLLPPTWQPLLVSGQESPVLVPFPVQRSAASPAPSYEGQVHLETSVPGKVQCHCQRRYVAVLLKEITIDPTALLPMLFAGDSQGFPCQLGSHTARLFLHQMARPTPSGCRTPPGRLGSDVYPPGFLCTVDGGVRDYMANPITIKNLGARERFLNPSPYQHNQQGRDAFSVALTFTAYSTFISGMPAWPEGCSGRGDSPYPQGSYSLVGSG